MFLSYCVFYFFHPFSVYVNLILITAADPENIMCINPDKKKEKPHLGCEAGTLNTLFTFSICGKSDYPGFTRGNVPEVEVSVREAVRLLSVGNGQGHFKMWLQNRKIQQKLHLF